MCSSAPVLPSTRPLSAEPAAPPCQKEMQRLQGPSEQNWKCLLRVLAVPACFKCLSLLYLVLLPQLPPAHPFSRQHLQPWGLSAVPAGVIPAAAQLCLWVPTVGAPPGYPKAHESSNPDFVTTAKRPPAVAWSIHDGKSKDCGFSTHTTIPTLTTSQGCH